MVAAFSIVALLFGVFGFVAKDYYVHRDPSVQANVYFYEGTGVNQQLVAESGNLITDIGENFARDVLGFNNVTDHNATISVSTGNASSITAALTKLDTEATSDGFERVDGNVTAWVNSGDYAFNVTAAFDASGTITVDSVGLHWSNVSDSDNNMFAASFITDGTDHQFPAASRLTVVWVITVNAN